MSTTSDRRVAETLYVAGAACLMLLNSTLVWGPFSLGFLDIDFSGISSLRFAGQIACALSIIISGFIAFIKPPRVLHQCIFAFLLLGLGFALFAMRSIGLLESTATSAMLLFATACSGAGNGVLLVLWLEILARRSNQSMKRLLLIANALVAIIVILLSFLTSTILMFALTFIAFPLMIVLTVVNLRIAVVPRKANDSPYSACVNAGKKFALPFLCIVALSLVQSMVSMNGNSFAAVDTQDIVVAQSARLIAVVALALIWFAFGRENSIPRMYVAMWPIFTTLFVLTFFLPNDSVWAFQLLGETCGAIMSITMVIAVIECAKLFNVNPQIPYGICVGAIYLSRPLFIPLAQSSVASTMPENMRAVTAVVLIIYLLTIPLFVIIRREVFSKKESELNQIDPTRKRSIAIAKRYKLTQRQTEVLCLLASGRDVPYIAETLILSQNTIRSYKKALYAQLGVHSKQELITLIEKEPIEQKDLRN